MVPYPLLLWHIFSTEPTTWSSTTYKELILSIFLVLRCFIQLKSFIIVAWNFPPRYCFWSEKPMKMIFVLDHKGETPSVSIWIIEVLGLLLIMVCISMSNANKSTIKNWEGCYRMVKKTFLFSKNFISDLLRGKKKA